ncbi:MAG: restriction endonuclease subunit R [Gallionellales bacterium GWA2_60_142]|nr:MAG: restriction endonuclease subunit R [Gallionellales bacterium GWA2_60_142]HCI14386.1 restriction endonuclease subunit R [Gallionellaceae bacterium]
MNELHLQDKFLIPFFRDGLGYKEVKANTVTQVLIIEEDLQAFISDTELNKKPYEALLKKYHGDAKLLLQELIALIQERIASSRNMALFINANKSINLQGIKLHLFYTSDSVIHDNALFDENIFSVVQELPYKYSFQGKQVFSFRPDVVLFVNGIYLGYSELKSNYTNQSASKNGRGKVIKDYFEAVKVYHQHIDNNAMLSDGEKLGYRKDFLKIFEKAIHITTTDIGETFVIRTIADYFDEILATCREGKFDREEIEKKAHGVFKPYPLLKPDADKPENNKQAKLKELFSALYGKFYIEKEILYYNFIERDVVVIKGVKEVKNETGHLISPRPKQKFGTDKIMSKIDEFLVHEQEPDYFEKLLEKQLAGVGEAKKKELLEKRKAYSNNKNVYSLLMQYAAGFGKSNIIGWSALQLKDLRRNGEYVYDKIMIVVDRLQLRGQIDSLMLNMNIDNRMVMEAKDKKSFQEALASDTRLVIVNLQKFGAVREMLDADVLKKLANMRIAFLIDEIHRSNSGDQHEDMVSIFDELQSPFDNAAYAAAHTKKNLIVGFTATPDDHTLARFGEFSGYAESEKLWRPFDSYTMKEAIEDGFILNPLKNIVPVASKMLFDLPSNPLEGFTEKEYKDAQKKQVYENRERIDAIAKYVADLLVKDVYRQIRGTGKAMLAVYSIKAAIAYQQAVTKHFNVLVQEPKYAKYADAPIHVVYSSNQDEQSASGMNGGLSEEKVLENFARPNNNGLMIVVAKLQTGFDEKKLHTLFLDKEITGISAIQTISRVNRTAKHKNDCKIVDFSYNNVNVQNIKDAFEHYSDVVVSDFDPFGDKKVLDILLADLKKSDTYDKFFDVFMAIYKDRVKRDAPESFLDFESSLKKYIDANPQRTADTKAKVAQYFTILNRIEYVIDLDAKYSEPGLLFFWRKFNTLYNMMHRSEDVKDPIEVYFDNQIGIIEVAAYTPTETKKKPLKVAEGKPPGGGYQFDILEIIAARNEHEALTGTLIQEFDAKIQEFFQHVRNATEGERLIVKIKSHVSEDEIYDDFAKIFRRYKALNRQAVGDYFFKETEDLVDKLCDDFEVTVRDANK